MKNPLKMWAVSIISSNIAPTFQVCRPRLIFSPNKMKSFYYISSQLLMNILWDWELTWLHLPMVFKFRAKHMPFTHNYKGIQEFSWKIISIHLNFCDLDMNARVHTHIHRREGRREGSRREGEERTESNKERKMMKK